MRCCPKMSGVIATVGNVFFILNGIASGILLMCALAFQDWMFLLFGILAFFIGGSMALLLNAVGLICEEIVRIRLILEENEHTSESTATSNTVIEHSSNPTLTETSTLPPSIQEALKKKRNG